MKDKIINIGVIGHVDHGKTTLTAAIASVMASKGIEQLKTIDEIIEEERSYKFEAPPELHLNCFDVKDGKQSRRERRANERKSNGTRK
jgi:translation initiation factor 2 gamma subunit (eIF-2gamma)